MTDETKKAETTKPARQTWEPPRLISEEIRETASPFPTLHRADSASPGLYTTPS